MMMAAPVQAQLHFGVKGGLNISKLDFSQSALKGDNNTGWFVGAMAEFTLPIVGIGVDVAGLYSQTDLGAKGVDGTMKLKTIEVPVNLKWSFGLGSVLGAYLAAYPQFGFNIGDKKGLGYELKKNNTSFNVGAGLKLIRHIQLGVNYNFGLSNTLVSFDEEAVKAKNNSWQVSLAYLF